jgi:Asp/Glu/hydantoin racemase
MTRIALIHATPLSVAPIADALARIWPQAQPMNLLDDSLSVDVKTALHAAIDARFIALARYAESAGAKGVLFTCSAFGPSIDAARRAVALPMLKPNEAMFDEALAAGTRVALLASFEPALAPMQAELLDSADAQGRAVMITARHVPGAFDALNAGWADEHDRLIGAAAAALPDHDVVMLAQFSMARAQAEAQRQSTAPVLCSPDSAVRRLRALLAS